MKKSIFVLTLLLYFGDASSNACWNEWERDGEWLIRSGECTENVSIPNPQILCRSRVKSDVARTAKKCPSTVKDFRKGKVTVGPVEFRCLGLKPPVAGGTANIFHYGLSKDPDGLEIVSALCTKFDGKWESAK